MDTAIVVSMEKKYCQINRYIIGLLLRLKRKKRGRLQSEFSKNAYKRGYNSDLNSFSKEELEGLDALSQLSEEQLFEHAWNEVVADGKEKAFYEKVRNQLEGASGQLGEKEIQERLNRSVVDRVSALRGIIDKRKTLGKENWVDRLGNKGEGYSPGEIPR